MQGRSNFISDGVVTGMAKSGETYIDSSGIIYLNTNVCCNQGSLDENLSYLWLYTAYSFVDAGITTYTTVEFTDDIMTVKTFKEDNSELLDSITIKKTEGFENRPVSFLLRNVLLGLLSFLS